MASRPQWTCRSFVQSSNRQTSIVNVLKQYIDRAEEIVGERTPDEEKYDREVIRWLRRGKNITKPLPRLIRNTHKALQVNDDNLVDVEAHYEYLAGHEAIMEKLDAHKK